MRFKSTLTYVRNRFVTLSDLLSHTLPWRSSEIVAPLDIWLLSAIIPVILSRGVGGPPMGPFRAR